MDTNSPKPSSRHLQYTCDEDKNGHTVSENIRVRNWGQVAKPPGSLNGTCSITLNLYLTQSKILINGKDASAFTDIFFPSLNNIIELNKDKLDMSNTLLGNMIATATDPQDSYGSSYRIKNSTTSSHASHSNADPAEAREPNCQPDDSNLSHNNSDAEDNLSLILLREEASVHDIIDDQIGAESTTSASTPVRSNPTNASPDRTEDSNPSVPVSRGNDIKIDAKASLQPNVDNIIARPKPKKGAKNRDANLLPDPLPSIPHYQPSAPQQLCPPTTNDTDVDRSINERLNKRDKELKAKERQLNKLEQSLHKQQIDQAEINLQNASLKALISKLEEKVRQQDEQIHMLQIQIQSASDRQLPSSNNPCNNANGSLENIMSLILMQHLQYITTPRPQMTDNHDLPAQIMKLEGLVNKLGNKVEEIDKKFNHDFEQRKNYTRNRNHHYIPPHRRQPNWRSSKATSCTRPQPCVAEMNSQQQQQPQQLINTDERSPLVSLDDSWGLPSSKQKSNIPSPRDWRNAKNRSGVMDNNCPPTTTSPGPQASNIKQILNWRSIQEPQPKCEMVSNCTFNSQSLHETASNQKPAPIPKITIISEQKSQTEARINQSPYDQNLKEMEEMTADTVHDFTPETRKLTTPSMTDDENLQCCHPVPSEKASTSPNISNQTTQKSEICPLPKTNLGTDHDLMTNSGSFLERISLKPGRSRCQPLTSTLLL